MDLLRFTRRSRAEKCVNKGHVDCDIERQWRLALAAAGISNLHIHGLRHIFASRYMEAGGDLNTLREMLGHSDFETTQRYAHIHPRVRKAAVALVFRPDALARYEKGMSPTDQAPAAPDAPALQLVVNGRS